MEAQNQEKYAYTKQQSDMYVLLIGVLAQMDMVGRERGEAVDYKMTVGRMVGDLTAVFGLEFVRTCQQIMQQSTQAGPQERLIASGNGHGSAHAGENGAG